MPCSALRMSWRCSRPAVLFAVVVVAVGGGCGCGGATLEAHTRHPILPRRRFECITSRALLLVLLQGRISHLSLHPNASFKHATSNWPTLCTSTRTQLRFWTRAHASLSSMRPLEQVCSAVPVAGVCVAASACPVPSCAQQQSTSLGALAATASPLPTLLPGSRFVSPLLAVVFRARQQAASVCCQRDSKS